MSVSAVTSALSSSTSLLALLGSSNTSASGGTLATSASSSAGDAVIVDLSEVAQAAASGDTSGKATAVAQLKDDLASEKTALLSGLGGSDPSSAADISDQLLSTIYGSSSLGSPTSQDGGLSGTTLDTTA